MNLLDLMVKIGVDDQASDKVAGIGSNIASVLGGAAKGVAAAVGAVTAAVGATATASLNAYASYEQNIGGIQKLFGNMGLSLEDYAAKNGTTTDAISGQWQSLENAQNTVLQNAQNAWETCGMSANTYMENATSISAALINSLGGDTEKAASQVDVAMRAISDNVNTFGTNIEDVTNAYKGFAKENYTMLDNLSLGYGGTKSEMERLISDANDYADTIGMTSDLSIDSFSDIVTAIELIQEKTNVAGTTTNEAAGTIEGSVNACKAAWDNWLTSLGSDDWDVSATTENLVTAIENVATNVVPRFTKILSTCIEQLPGLIGTLAPEVASFFEQIFATAFETIKGTLPEEFQGVFDTLCTAGETLSTTLQPTLEALASVGEVVMTFFSAMGDTINSNLMPAIEPLCEAWNQLMEALQGAQPWLEVIAAGLGETLVVAITGVVEILTTLIAAVAEIISGFTSFVEWITQAGASAGEFVTTVGEFFATLPETIAGFLGSVVASIGAWVVNIVAQAVSAGSGFFSSIGSFFSQVPGSVAGFLSSVISTVIGFAGNLLTQAIGAGQHFYNGIKAGFDTAVQFVSGIPGKIVSALGNVGSLLVNAGKSIINGLKQGIESAISGVYDFVSGIADKIASLKGPLPYDRRVLIPNGKALMQSLGTGLREGFGDVETLVSGMADTIAEDMSLSGASVDFGGVTATATYRAGGSSLMSETNDLLKQILAKDASFNVDGKALARSIAKPMNQQLGILSARGY